jgi:hypothetical protein
MDPDGPQHDHHRWKKDQTRPRRKCRHRHNAPFETTRLPVWTVGHSWS